MKENKIIIRLDKSFSDEYFNMCKNEGYTMSKRVRRFMELDNELDKLSLNSVKELEKLLNKNEKM
jgi:hypothetical protein